MEINRIPIRLDPNVGKDEIWIEYPDGHRRLLVYNLATKDDESVITVQKVRKIGDWPWD
jgi:hypothetical protein